MKEHFAGADDGICLANGTLVFATSEADRCRSAWETGIEVGHVDRAELSGSVSSAQPTGIYCLREAEETAYWLELLVQANIIA